jgi:succinate dehydrogenase / fumarate reductase membrane anchor subunit
VLNKIFLKANIGLRNWLFQRLTAMVMALYSIVITVLLAVNQPGDYLTWKAMFSPAWIRWATLLFFWSLVMHAWLGVRDILKDYVSSMRVRMFLQSLFAAALLVYAIWAATILWSR